MRKTAFLFFFSLVFFIKITYGGTNYLVPIGHDTVFIHLDRVNIITDPNWNSKDLFLYRLTPPPFPLSNLPPVDLVLVSHGHFDHFDLGTIQKIHKKNRNVRILLPKNLGYLLKRMGLTNYRECIPGEEIPFKGLLIKTYRAKHDGRRFIIDNTSLSLMYLISGSRSVFFSGDTGYTNLFKTIGQNENIDVALLMIGIWNHMPSLIRSKHLASDEAIKVFMDLKAGFMVPIHYDTFPLGRGRDGEPVRLLLQTARSNHLEDRVLIRKFGTRILIK